VFAKASWDFPESSSRRAFHPYPARFIPEIPAQALDLLKVDGPVLDPFCGSGTTLVEAQLRGLPSVGIDLNPIACLISRVSTGAWTAHDAQLGLEHANALYHSAASCGDVADFSHRIPRINHWFDSWAAEALAGAIKYVGDVRDNLWRDRVAVAISSAIVRISRQDSDTRYAAVDKRGSRLQAAAELARAVVRICEWLCVNNANDRKPSAEVYCRDARDMTNLPSRSFAATIFSPPYPNAYEYWLYHKYRMYWLGFDPIAVREAELGARPHYCKPNGLTETDFALQMDEVFSELGRVLSPSAPTIVVVGDSTIQGRRVDNGKLLSAIAVKQGFTVEVQARRRILARRSSFNRAHSRGRKHEHVLLFRAPD
jgi:site-specific DNA-methyltransferase (cytosine-N4-specific)